MSVVTTALGRAKATTERENNNIETWDNMFAETDFSQGDVVRTFKRTIDVLRQLVIIDGINENLKQTAREAIKLINVEPINVD